jgi:hypothetical protein
MNDLCIEECAIKRDCSHFQPRPDLKLEDMPRFPKTQGMTREEKFTSVAIYLSKVVDHLQGVPYEHATFVTRRPDSHSEASSRVPSAIEIKDLLPDPAPANTVYQAGSERADSAVGSKEVAGPED